MKLLKYALIVAALFIFRTAVAATTWSAQDYDVYSGDFDGDGIADILYVAKAPGNLSGIARGVGGGYDASFQSWPSNFLGLQWSGNQYTVVILQNAAVTNSRASILLQSTVPGGTSYLLQPNAQGRIVGISQQILMNAGLSWSSDQHHLVSGDFNNDGFADIFLQATSPSGTNAVILADANGQFTASAPAQQWSDGFLGFNWATNEAIVYAGNFDGQYGTDLLIQARPRFVMIAYDVPFPVPTFPPNLNGIVFAHASGNLFQAAAVPGQALGYYQWSRNAFGVDWSPLVTNVIVGDFYGTGRSDVLLQAKATGHTSYLLEATGTSGVFSTGAALAGNVNWSADTVRLVVTRNAGGSSAGVYVQALTPAGTNMTATSITGASVSTVTQDPTQPPPNTAPIAAGRTPGTFTVSSSGGASYSIPLWSPPGVGALQLSLALNYSSRVGDGIMGVGWSIGGLSSITRCNRTVSQDGAASGVTNTTSDRFCLDGQELKSAGSGVYATEIEDFKQITSSGTVGAGPASFTVTSRNGLIYDYGSSANSQIMAGSSGTVRTWALSRIRDRVGNSIALTYINDTVNGTYRVSEIDYPTTASGEGPFYSVTFAYRARPQGANVPTGYIAGTLVQEPNELLSVSIQNYQSPSPTRTYNLSYSVNAVSSRLQLTNVQQCSASECVPPTTINYQPGSQGWINNANPTGVTAVAPIPVDLNGDGLTDLLYPVAASGSTTHWWVAFSNGTGYGAGVDTHIVTRSTDRIIIGAFSGGVPQILAPLCGTSACSGSQVGTWHVIGCSTSGCSTAVDTQLSVGGETYAVDYDGDGLPDLVAFVGTAVTVRQNMTPPGGSVKFASSAMTVWNAASASTIATIAVGGSVLSTADFNGDGRADLVVSAVSHTGTFGTLMTWGVIISSGFSAAPTVTTINRNSDPADPNIGDWNGDGCTDIISAAIVYVSNCNGGFSQISTGQAAALTFIPVDWDGDGLTDIIYNYNNTNSWYLLRSTGNGFAPLTPLGISAPTSTSWFTLDQNGDGLVDLAYVDGNNGNAVKFLTHAGAGSPPDQAYSFTDGFGVNQTVSYSSLSQGQYTECASAASSCSPAVFPERDFQGPLYVVSQFSASDGLGSTYQNQFWYYGATVQMQGRGFEGFFARRTYDSRNGVYTYDYTNRAFPYTGTPSQQVVATTPNYISGAMQCSIATHCLSSWSATPASQSVTGLGGYETRTFRYQSPITQTRYESGGSLDGQAITTAVTQYTYADGYGNPTNISTTVTDLDPTSPFLQHEWTSTTANTFLNDTSAWCIGLDTGTTVTNQADGQTAQTRTYSVTPDTPHTLCRDHQRNIEPTTPALNVTQTLTYDTCGNVSEQDVVGHNYDGSVLPTRTTKYDYNHFSSRCQLPEMVTDALGKAVTVSYNYNFGVPSQRIDANSVPTTWSYDDFGRAVQELRADGTTTNWAFKYCVNAPCWGFNDLRFLTIQSENDANGANYFTRDLFFDGMQRLRFDESNRALGTWTVNQSRSYDQLGRLLSLVHPYSQSDNGYWSYSYDTLNRPTSARLYQTSSPSAALEKTYSLIYTGRTTTITDPNKNVTSRVADVLGHLRRVIDPKPAQGSAVGATTFYNYDDFGNLAYIQDPIGAISTATYNLRGFKTDMTDADAGSWHFNGDSLNELISYTDGKGQSIGPLGYDALGRLTSRTEPEGLSTWTWGSDPTLHNIGSLQSVAGYGYEEDRNYDSLGRLTTRVINTDQVYQYDFHYNALGSLDTVTYPAPGPTGTTATRTEIQYGYSAGFPVQINDITQGTSVPLWNLSAVNDYSAPVNETLGGGTVAVTSSYTPWTNQLVGIQSGSGGSASNLQNLTYGWDASGNLTSRQDSNQNLTEGFNYDSLNRPTGSTLNGVANFSVSYTDTSGNDRGGNVQSRSDSSATPLAYDYTTQQAGCNYSGLSAQPHAVRNVGGGTYVYCYDANGNVTSRNGLSITLSSYNLPTSLQASAGGAVYSSQLSYGPDRERYQQSATYSNGTELTSYAGGMFEKVTGSAMSGNTVYRHYVETPSGLTIVIARNATSSTTTYALADHLGSTDALVSGTSGTAGTLLARESFGPFGQRRASNWAAGSPNASEWTSIANTTRRGFTYQEELDNVQMIHMNGRVYDPNVGRFLSVDPVIGDQRDSQSVNPYAYVGNRPLTRIDPSGFDGDDPASDGGTVTVVGQNLAAVGVETFNFTANITSDFISDFFSIFGGGGSHLPPPAASAVHTQTAQSGLSDGPCSGPGCEVIVSAAPPGPPYNTGAIQLGDANYQYFMIALGGEITVSAQRGSPQTKAGTAPGVVLGSRAIPWGEIGEEAGKIGGRAILAQAAAAGIAVGLVMTPSKTAEQDEDSVWSGYHATDPHSAVAFLNGMQLDPAKVDANRFFTEADLGFYLAEQPHLAEYVGSLRFASFALIQVSINMKAMNALQAAGATFNEHLPLNGVPAGKELFVPVSAFPVFNAEMAAGRIFINPVTDPNPFSGP